MDFQMWKVGPLHHDGEAERIYEAVLAFLIK